MVWPGLAWPKHCHWSRDQSAKYNLTLSDPAWPVKLSDPVLSGLDWSGLVWFGLVWSGLVWSGLVWFGLAWYGLAWSGLVWPIPYQGLKIYAAAGMIRTGLVWTGLVYTAEEREGQ